MAMDVCLTNAIQPWARDPIIRIITDQGRKMQEQGQQLILEKQQHRKQMITVLKHLREVADGTDAVSKAVADVVHLVDTVVGGAATVAEDDIAVERAGKSAVSEMIGTAMLAESVAKTADDLANDDERNVGHSCSES